MLIEVLCLAGAFVVGLVVMFFFLKNNPKYLVQSLQKDKADIESKLANVETQIKTGIVAKVEADVKKETPVVEKDIATVVTEAKAAGEKILKAVETEVSKL